MYWRVMARSVTTRSWVLSILMRRGVTMHWSAALMSMVACTSSSSRLTKETRDIRLETASTKGNADHCNHEPR
jgi:hypothetical protein